MRDFVSMSMAVSAVAVSVAMLVEKEQSHNVRSQSQASNDQDQLRLRDLLRLDKSLNGFEEDADTQRDQEDTVDQRTQSLGALPAVCVHFRACLGVRDLDGPETDTKREDIVEHVEGIGNQGKRVDGISDGEFEEEEERVDDQEDDDLGGLREGHDGGGRGKERWCCVVWCERCLVAADDCDMARLSGTSEVIDRVGEAERAVAA